MCEIARSKIRTVWRKIVRSILRISRGLEEFWVEVIKRAASTVERRCHSFGLQPCDDMQLERKTIFAERLSQEIEPKRSKRLLH